MWIPRWAIRWAVKTVIRESPTLSRARLSELADEGQQHSQSAHHDNTIHTDCDECMRICDAIVRGMGLSAEQSAEGMRRVKSKFTHVSEELVKRQSAPLGRGEEKEKIH